MLAFLFCPRKKIAALPERPFRTRAQRVHSAFTKRGTRLLPAFFAALLLLLPVSATADVVIESNGKTMSLDRRGQLESPEGDRSFSTPPRPEANATDTDLERLPYGIVPEVYVPWYPQWQWQRPLPLPQPPGWRPPPQGGRPPRPDGKPPLDRPLPGPPPGPPPGTPPGTPPDVQRPSPPNPGQRPTGYEPGYNPGYPRGYSPGYTRGDRAVPGTGRPQGYIPVPRPGGAPEGRGLP